MNYTIGNKAVMRAVVTLSFILTVISGAFARDKNHHNVVIPEAVQVGQSHLAPGEYMMEWNASGSTAEVIFLQNRKSVAQVTAKVVNLGHPAETDSVTMKTESGATESLEQIRFGGHREAFTFSDSPSGE